MRTFVIGIFTIQMAAGLCANTPAFSQNKTNGTAAAKQTSAPVKLVDTITGQYVTKDGDLLAVKRLPSGKVKYQLQAFYPSANPSLKDNPGGPNLGTAEGEASVKGNTMVIVPPDTTKCRITVVFRGQTADVKQSGCDSDCGFGLNVDATGSYKKKSSKPDFVQLDN